MKINTAILFILITIVACKSNKTKLLEENAIQSYVDKDYLSAEKYYKQLLEVSDKNKEQYYLKQIENCEEGIKQNKLTKKEIRLTILKQSQLDEKFGADLSNLSRRCYLKLADIYISEKKYDTALINLKIAESKYPLFSICNAGRFEEKYLLNYQFAQCYAGLGQLDSAISVLTPNMFVKQKDVYIDSLEYETINKFYLKIITKKYSKAELKTKLNKAINEVVYIKQKNKEFDDLTDIQCYFLFLNCRIDLFKSSIDVSSWHESIIFLSKEYLCKDAKETETYKKINNFD
jgi:tetratricopeptide (TPR) repeat protein